MASADETVPGRARRRTGWTLAAGLAVVAAAGCSSTSSKSAPPTTVTPTTQATKHLSVVTPEGQVSLSLDGQLPPGWPAQFPVPAGATPAGSGSLGSAQTGTSVAVYNTSQSPPQTFDFYRTNQSLTVVSSKALGSGTAYIGRVTISNPWKGSVTVVPSSSASMAVVVLSTSTGSTTSSTTPTG
jgi:hypothetical protein